jgi:hypothetical protein
VSGSRVDTAGARKTKDNQMQKGGGVRGEVNRGGSTALFEQQRQEGGHQVHCKGALENSTCGLGVGIGDGTCVGNANKHELAALAEWQRK